MDCFRCVAMVDIAEGEEITTKYLPPTVCSLLRRPAMKEGWFFDCRSVQLDLNRTETGMNSMKIHSSSSFQMQPLLGLDGKRQSCQHGALPNMPQVTFARQVSWCKILS